MKLHLEGSQLSCEEDCHISQLVDLACNVEDWSQHGSVVRFTL